MQQPAIGRKLAIEIPDGESPGNCFSNVRSHQLNAKAFLLERRR